jgi:hypothetical protein
LGVEIEIPQPIVGVGAVIGIEPHDRLYDPEVIAKPPLLVTTQAMENLAEQVAEVDW